MCDERTASKMTALNTAKRNGLTGQHIIEMAQLQQHWTYGLDSPRYQHQAHLTLPKAPSQSSSSQKVYLPTPTLQDLLNPATDVDIESLFTNPDPYGIDELTDDDGNESDDNEAEQTVTRGAPRLIIDNLVDLMQPRLIARYDGGAVQESKKSSTLLQKSGGKSTPWVREKFSMADIDF